MSKEEFFHSTVFFRKYFWMQGDFYNGCGSKCRRPVFGTVRNFSIPSKRRCEPYIICWNVLLSGIILT